LAVKRSDRVNSNALMLALDIVPAKNIDFPPPAPLYIYSVRREILQKRPGRAWWPEGRAWTGVHQ